MRLRAIGASCRQVPEREAEVVLKVYITRRSQSLKPSATKPLVQMTSLRHCQQWQSALRYLLLGLSSGSDLDFPTRMLADTDAFLNGKTLKPLMGARIWHSDDKRRPRGLCVALKSLSPFAECRSDFVKL